jgi:hypothetical protein
VKRGLEKGGGGDGDARKQYGTVGSERKGLDWEDEKERGNVHDCSANVSQS